MSPKDGSTAELSVFVVTPSSSNINGPAADLSDINGISCRKRKRHLKSRSGCIACKRRRVKCDDVYPSCRSCVRRGESCSLLNSPPQCSARTPSPPTPPTPSRNHGLHLQQPPSHGFCNGLNMLQMALFHNFAENTVVSLPFGGNVWHEDVVPLALKHDYLMHAVLLLSAKHLSYLSPRSFEYHQASLFHLSKLLPRYREEVAKPLSIENADSIMAASFLLLYFVWSNVDTFDMEDSACFINDQLFAMTVGVREMFLSACFILSTGQSIFSESVAYHPKYAIKRTAKQCAKPPSHFERYFCDRCQQYPDNSILNIGQDSPQNTPQLPDILNGGAQMNHNDLWYAVTQPQDPLLIGFLDAAVRLAPLSSIASELQTSPQQSGPSISQEEATRRYVLPGSSPPTLVDLARYIFSWPVVSSPGVLRLLERKDKRIIFLLYQFYKVIKVLLPKTYWWAHQRADKMITIFNENLAKSTVDPPGSAQDFELPEDVVARATDFAVQANEKWRQYCLMYATASTLQHPVTPAPNVMSSAAAQRLHTALS